MDIGTIMNLMFPMLGMNLFLIYGMKSEQNQAGIYVYSGLFMAVMSAVCSILWLMISRKYEKREQQKKVNKERLAYRRYLNKKSEYIKVQYERVYKVLQSRYLRADTYLDSPLLDMYLWNRNLYHKDFLMYRIGIGDVEFPMKIEFPEEVFGDEENILWREAKKIKEHYEILHQIPVLLDMGRYSQIGIITKDTIAGMELVRSIILQIALCNCYTEVKIGCIYNKNKVIQSQQWDFCRWLPHIWDANRQKRFIAGNEVEARRLFYDLLQIFKEREEVSISGKAEKILPHYILFVAEEQFLEGEMFSKYILDGTDQSGERGTGDFMDFYKTLHSLNQFEVTQKSTKSDLAAAYLISREITIEIMNYAEQFLKDSSINKKMLNKELEKIEERTKYFIKEKKQMEELYQFMNEAKQKIEIADSFKDKEDVRDAGGT